MTVTVEATEVASVPAELLARWRRVPPAIVADLAPECQIDPAIRPLLPPGSGRPLFGRALTVRCDPPDFGAVVMAIGRVGLGQVLVIDAAGDAGTAMIGEILGGHLHRQGGVGLICDGAVRDVDALAAMPGLAVYARSVTPRGPASARGGVVDGPVVIGGCRVAPGDLLVGDGDGLVSVPPERLADLIGPAEAKLKLEADWTRRLAAGEDPRTIFGLP